MYMHYSTKEMKIKKLKACLPGYENFSMSGETNNQFSMAFGTVYQQKPIP